jgi:hypothetical protein
MLAAGEMNGDGMEKGERMEWSDNAMEVAPNEMEVEGMNWPEAHCLYKFPCFILPAPLKMGGRGGGDITKHLSDGHWGNYAQEGCRYHKH